jgi:DNA-binding NarL/FixJ family response regulator
MTHRVLIVEDHNLLRQGLRSMLSTLPDFEVVGEACDGKEALREAAALEPHVVLMDISLPGMNGIEATAHIKRRQPYVKVLILTVFKTEEYVREALRVGADGYVLKDASYEELLVALRSVAKGKTYLSPDVSSHVVDSFLNPEHASPRDTPWQQLTTRERSILQLIAEGRTNRLAAEFLNVSPKTVEKHRANLMRKLGLRNAGELILVAVEMGLIQRPGAVSRVMGDTTSGTSYSKHQTGMPEFSGVLQGAL